MTEVIYLPACAEVRREERTVLIKPHTTPGKFSKTSSKPYHQEKIECYVDEVDHFVNLYSNGSWLKIYVVGKAEALARR